MIVLLVALLVLFESSASSLLVFSGRRGEQGWSYGKHKDEELEELHRTWPADGHGYGGFYNSKVFDARQSTHF